MITGLDPIATLLLVVLGFFVAVKIIDHIQRILCCLVAGAFLIGVGYPVVFAVAQYPL